MFPNPAVNYEDGPQVPMANPTAAYRRSLERVTRLLQRFVDSASSSSIMRGLVAVTALLAATVATGTLDFSPFFDVRAADLPT